MDTSRSPLWTPLTAEFDRPVLRVGLCVAVLVVGGAVPVAAADGGFGTAAGSQDRGDRFEDNDGPGTAAEVDLGRYANLSVSASDKDYYRLDPDEGVVTVRVTPTRHVENLSLRVADESGTVADGTRQGDSLVATFTADTFAEYTILVSGAGTADTGYELSLNRSDGNDRFEANDERDEATAIEPGALSDLQIVDGESDYFAVNLSAGESVTATARFADEEGDLDMELLGPDGRNLDAAYSVTDDETVEAVADENGTYYVEVYGYVDASAPYSLTVSVDSAGPGGDDDPEPTGANSSDLEPNDEFETAAAVSPGRYVDREIATGTDHDYYAVEVEDGQTLDVSVEFDDTEGDLDVTVFDEDRNRLDGGYSVTDDESLEITATESGTYYVEVYGYSGDTAPYTLELTVDGEGPATDDAGGDGTDPDDDDPRDDDDSTDDDDDTRDDDDGTPFGGGDTDLRQIDVGETRDGEIDTGDPESSENRGHYEPVTLNGSAGEVVSISMESVSGDTYLILRGPDGDVVGRDDDGGSGLDSEIDGVELPENGEYTIVATSYSRSDTFEYTLSVTAGFGGGPQAASMDLTVEAPTATAGERVTLTFNLTNTGSDSEPFVVETGLRPLPAGWTITDHADDGARWRGADAAWVLPSVAPNGSVQPSVTVSVPRNATSQEFRASAFAQRGEVRSSYTVDVDG